MNNNTHAAKVPGLQPDGSYKLVTRYVSNQTAPEIDLLLAPSDGADWDAVDNDEAEFDTLRSDMGLYTEKDALASELKVGSPAWYRSLSAERDAEAAAITAPRPSYQREADIQLSEIRSAADLEEEAWATAQAARSAKFPGSPDFYTGHTSQPELLAQRDEAIHSARRSLEGARSHIQMVAGMKYSEVAGALRIPYRDRGEIRFEAGTTNVDWDSVHPDARESVKKEHDRVVAVYTDAANNREKFAMDVYALGASQPPFLTEPDFYNKEPIDARAFLRKTLDLEEGTFMDGLGRAIAPRKTELSRA